MTVLQPTSFRLTELTECGGCAAKLGADLLADALAGLGAETSPDELIAGLNPPDDAAVYRISDELAIIGTLDFFPPLVDDPRTFGEIAAANALSDVFAMGGRVMFALSIAAFPEALPSEVMTELFAGASAKVREAGGTLSWPTWRWKASSPAVPSTIGTSSRNPWLLGRTCAESS